MLLNRRSYLGLKLPGFVARLFPCLCKDSLDRRACLHGLVTVRAGLGFCPPRAVAFTAAARGGLAQTWLEVELSLETEF